MSSAAEEHVVYQIANAPMLEYPYPHIYVEQVFPEDFYAQIRANWPDSSAFTSLADTGRVSKGSYAERFVLPFTPTDIEKLSGDRRSFWSDFGRWFLGVRLQQALVRKFDRYVNERFGDLVDDCRFAADSLIVRDHTNYKIGPHTDASHRLLSLLFYCPGDNSMKHLGTSIYVPQDPDFRCDGGPHYPHKLFHKVKTMEYKPNSLFAFFKTDRSFHGVEPITDRDTLRDILLYDIRVFNSGRKQSAQSGSLGLKLLRRLFGAVKN